MTRFDLSLLRRWIVAHIRLTLRNPRATFFTFVFPLMFLLLFNAINGNAMVPAAGGEVPYAQFYTPSIGIFGLTLACYTTVIFGLAHARDMGIFKRVKGTPLPLPIYLSSWLVGAVLTGLTSVVVMFAFAVPLFGVDIYARMLPAAIVTVVVGAVMLSSLGLLVASFVRSADQAMPVAQLTFLPLSFISGIWYPLDGAPDWVVKIADFFPLYHLAQAFGSAFTPDGGWEPQHLAVLAIWTAGALVIAVRRFRSEP